MRAVAIIVLACGMLGFAIPSEDHLVPILEIPEDVEPFKPAPIPAAQLLEFVKSKALADDDEVEIVAEDRMDTGNDEVKISKRIFKWDEPTTEAPHGWGWGGPQPQPHGAPVMALAGPFAFQLGAYYNPYLPAPAQYGGQYPSASYNARPYSAPRYPSSNYYTTTTTTTTEAPTTEETTTTAAPTYAPSYAQSYAPMPSYATSYNHNPSSTYGTSYNPPPANPLMLAYSPSYSSNYVNGGSY